MSSVRPNPKSRSYLHSQLTVIVTFVFCLVCSVVNAQQETTPTSAQKTPNYLVEKEPYDLIQLDDINSNIRIKIKPLEQPLADPLPTQGYLVFEAPELSDDRLQVPFTNVQSYQSFNDLLREEANQFIRDEQYGNAFRNLIYIYDHGGKNDAAVRNLIQNLLFRDAAKNYFAGNFELALTIFQDIYERDKNFRAPGISKKPVDLIIDCLNRNIAAKLADKRYDQVHAAVNDLEIRYGQDGKKAADDWKKKLLEESNRLLKEAEEIAAKGNGHLAHLTARKANSVLPGRPESARLFRRILSQYPIIFVGVGQTSNFTDPLNFDHWASGRIGRLTRRSIVEFVGPGDDGGEYKFLNGKIERLDDRGYMYRLRIEPNEENFAVPQIDAYRLTRKLLAHASMRSEDYHVPFAKIVDSIEIENAHSVLLKLNKAFIKFDALLLMPYLEESESDVANGPYVLAEKRDNLLIFEKNDRYADLANRQHPQLVEWSFDSSTEAVNALIRGEMDVVDRVLPADTNRLEKDASIRIGSYIVPTVHMLVPNDRNAFMANRVFRNGLKQAINRELILSDVICGGGEVDGCELISGPFPIGTEENDQLSYAYNLKINPEPFNDRLGMVLARVVLETQRNKLVSQGVKNPDVRFEPLTLAYPDDEVSEAACFNIQQMWESIGLTVSLRKLSDSALPPDEDWDLLYYQLSMFEPLTDVDRLFGRGGVVKNVSAPVEQNMQRIGYAESWQNAGKTLRRIHRQVVNDVSIIPLWQIKEHFAYRKNVQGIVRDPVHLYQNIQEWSIQTIDQEN